MADFKWVSDDEHPQGWLVPLTAAEQAQHDADQAAGQTNAATQAVAAANAATVAAASLTRLAQIRTARSAIAAGSLFAALSTNEKAVLDGLLQDDLYLIRIALQLYDGTN